MTTPTHPALSGHAALVTGASSGIGRAVAVRLRALGMDVALLARRTDRLREIVDGAGSGGPGRAIAVETDLTRRDDVTSAVHQVVAELGRLDVLVNAAGVMLLGPAADAPLEEWWQMIDVNLTATMSLTHAAIPALLDAAATSGRGTADIVNISSTAGRVARKSSAGYAATKHGLNAFTESIRQDLAASHVRVAVVEPGGTATELMSHNRPGVRDALVRASEDLDLLAPEDIADAVEYVVTRPARVAVAEILVRPWNQDS